MTWVRCLLFTFAVVLGATLSRWHGGGVFPAPKWVRNVAFSLPIGLSLIYINYQSLMSLGYGSFADVFAAIIATVCILLFKALGHGGGFDLAHSSKEPNNGRDLERIERWFFLYPKAYNSLPRYWYDALILAIKGALMALVPAAIIAVNSALGAVIMFGSGAIGFPLAYMIWWAVFDRFPKLITYLGGVPTELAEITSGGLFFGGFVLAIFTAVL